MKKTLTFLTIPLILAIAGCSTSQKNNESDDFVAFGVPVNGTYSPTKYPEYRFYRNLSSIYGGKQYKKIDNEKNKYFISFSEKNQMTSIRKESKVFEDINDCQSAFYKDSQSIESFINKANENEEEDNVSNIRYGSVGYAIEYIACKQHGRDQSNYSIDIENKGKTLGNSLKNFKSKF